MAVSTTAYANDTHDRTQVGSSINVGPGEEVNEATCFGCSIHVRGHVAGDVTTFGGSIIVEDGGQVDGDATSFGGGVRLEREVKVGGDITVFGGRVYRDSDASVGGDVTSMGGPGWLLVIVAMPFVFLGLFVWAVIWVVRRLLRPSVAAAA
jgi:hypothetical protein